MNPWRARPGTPAGTILVHDDAAAATMALAERVALDAAAAIRTRGQFRLGVSGGETPVGLYRLLASKAWRDRIDWSRVVVLFADERGVPAGSAERNDQLVRETLTRPLGMPDSALRPMCAEAEDLEAAAHDYERELQVPIDLLLLGLGSDGHVASLFPGHATVLERERRVAAVKDSPKPPPRRLTLTPRTLDESRAIAVLCTGAAKAAAVRRALSGAAAMDCPGALVAMRDWYVDHDAMSQPRSPR